MMERYGESERALIFSMSFRFHPFLNVSQAVPQRHVLRQNAMFKFGLLGLHQSHELPPTCEDLVQTRSNSNRGKVSQSWAMEFHDASWT